MVNGSGAALLKGTRMRVTVFTVRDSSGNIAETHVRICNDLTDQPGRKESEAAEGTVAVLPNYLHRVAKTERSRAARARKGLSERLSLLTALAIPVTRLLLDIGPTLFTAF